jgi:hypothetical protein
MNYESFMTLKFIMSATLGELARKTEAQKARIAGQEEKLQGLMIEEEKLN